MKPKMPLLFVFAMIFLCTTNLNAQIRAGAFSVSPNAGYYFFDDDQEIKRSPTYGLGIGYDFTDRVGIEGSYNLLNTEAKIGGTEIDGYLGRLELLMNLLTEKRFVPYFTIGAGKLSLKPEGGDSDSQFFGNWGVGMKYFFNDYMAFRVDGRQIMTSSDINYLATAGLTFYFGGQKKAQVAEERPVPALPPKDSDGDGVIDDKDQCPNTPAGVKVDAKGCPLDSDKDGVTDDKDQCPDTPAGVKVDAKGCPLDTDEDGVTDDKDQCSNTPKGATVDSRGCWILKDLKFDTAKADIKADGARILDDVVTIMQANPSLKIEIQGHTDNKGSSAYNKTLSQKRANAVMEYIAKKGVEKERLSAIGYGFEKPAASNDTEEGRAENRRVELNPIQ